MEKVVDRDYLISYLESLYNNAKCRLNFRNDYELLVSIVLSAQTTDDSVNKVTPFLFEKYPTIKDLSNADLETVEKIIRSIGLYKNKSKNIIELAKMLCNDGYSIVPNNFDYLLKLPGVGRKTTNVFLSEYYNENTLGIDTHLGRLAKRLYLASETDDPLKIEIKLLKYLEGYSSKKFHHMMIAFGRDKCTAQSPKCSECKLKDYCKNGVGK